jgi:hypothetical protein
MSGLHNRMSTQCLLRNLGTRTLVVVSRRRQVGQGSCCLRSYFRIWLYLYYSYLPFPLCPIVYSPCFCTSFEFLVYGSRNSADFWSRLNPRRLSVHRSLGESASQRIPVLIDTWTSPNYHGVV